MLPLIKLLTPAVTKKILDYVFKDNNLDQQMGSVRSRLDKLENDMKNKKGKRDL